MVEWVDDVDNVHVYVCVRYGLVGYLGSGIGFRASVERGGVWGLRGEEGERLGWLGDGLLNVYRNRVYVCMCICTIVSIKKKKEEEEEEGEGEGMFIL